MNQDVTRQSKADSTGTAAPPSVSIDWYAEGNARIVQVGEVQIEVRLVGRNGRRARIAIKAPAGAVFTPGGP